VTKILQIILCGLIHLHKVFRGVRLERSVLFCFADERRCWREFHMGVFRLAYYYRIVLHAQSRARCSQRVSQVRQCLLLTHLAQSFIMGTATK